MSHEIRTPLNSIIGFSEILGEKLKDEKLQGYVSNIQTSGKNLLSIVNEMGLKNKSLSVLRKAL